MRQSRHSVCMSALPAEEWGLDGSPPLAVVPRAVMNSTAGGVIAKTPVDTGVV
jgi:hypothetical protein